MLQSMHSQRVGHNLATEQLLSNIFSYAHLKSLGLFFQFCGSLVNEVHDLLSSRWIRPIWRFLLYFCYEEPVCFPSFFSFRIKYLEEDDGTPSMFYIVQNWWTEGIFLKTGNKRKAGATYKMLLDWLSPICAELVYVITDHSPDEFSTDTATFQMKNYRK